MGSDSARRSQQGGSKTKGARSGGVFGSARESTRDCPKIDEIAEIGRILDSVTAAGDAIIFSRTSDGGAVVITLLSDGGREKAYASTDAELSRAFEDLRAKYGEA
jgi:hypothetical protein